MNSMTGFGRAERSGGGLRVAAQASSVNRRSFEAVCSFGKDYLWLERKAVELVRSRVARGRVQVAVEIVDERRGSSAFPSDEVMDAAVQRLERLAARRKIPAAIDAPLLVALAQLAVEEPERPAEASVEPLLLEALEEALEGLAAMRAAEGEALRADLRERLARLRSGLEGVEAASEGMVEAHRERLFARLKQSGLDLDLDDERVLKEVALFADRSDISEELTRLRSHLDQFETLLDKEGEPVGRPLEFLLQEIGREVNTLGSKASAIEATRGVIEMKKELERIREQAANVE